VQVHVQVQVKGEGAEVRGTEVLRCRGAEADVQLQKCMGRGAVAEVQQRCSQVQVQVQEGQEEVQRCRRCRGAGAEVQEGCRQMCRRCRGRGAVVEVQRCRVRCSCRSAEVQVQR
jgi:hypothetical protein